MQRNPNRKVTTSLVPDEVTPYIRRLSTRDISNYIESHNEGAGQNSLQDRAKKILKTPYFDLVIGAVILVNMLFLVFEVDRAASDGEKDPADLHWAEVGGWVALGIFIIELLVRVFAARRDFFKDTWDVFDASIVALDCIFSVLSVFLGHIFPVSVLRIFRLAKLARAFKVLRVFPELRLMLAGLFSAMSAIFWGTLLLGFVMLMWAMVAVLFIHPLNKDIDYDDCQRCPRAYGTVMNAVLTLWQSIVAGDGWGSATIPIIEKYPSTAIYFIVVYLSVGMGVVNLILGVVVNVASQTVSALADEDDVQAALVKLENGTHLLELCKKMDTNDDGELSREELSAAFEQPGEFRDTILGLGLSNEEFDVVWEILDDNRSGEVSYKEFVNNIASMKTSDSSFMLAYIKYYIAKLRNSLQDRIHTETQELGRAVSMELERIEQHEREFVHEMEIVEQQEELILEDEALIKKQVGGEQWKEESIQKNSEIKGNFSHNSRHQAPPVGPPRDKTAHFELDQFREDIAKMCSELKGLLIDIDRKLGQPHLHLAAMPNLPAVPTKSIFTACGSLTTQKEEHQKIPRQGFYPDSR